MPGTGCRQQPGVSQPDSGDLIIWAAPDAAMCPNGLCVPRSLPASAVVSIGESGRCLRRSMGGSCPHSWEAGMKCIAW